MDEFLVRLAKAKCNGVLPDGFFMPEVAHDDFCGVYEKKECNCDPEITVVINGSLVRITKDGGGVTIRKLS